MGQQNHQQKQQQGERKQVATRKLPPCFDPYPPKDFTTPPSHRRESAPAESKLSMQQQQYQQQQQRHRRKSDKAEKKVLPIPVNYSGKKTGEIVQTSAKPFEDIVKMYREGETG